jgi:hypothetical protein
MRWNEVSDLNVSIQIYLRRVGSSLKFGISNASEVRFVTILRGSLVVEAIVASRVVLKFLLIEKLKISG